VDLSPESAVRRKFSEAVLRRSVASVRSYWQQIIFAGRDVRRRSSILTKTSSSMFSSTRVAVGYVTGNAKIGTLRVVSVQ